MVTRRPANGGIEWSTIPLHPLLMAAAPVLFLFAENVVQQVTLRPLWAPLALALAAALVALLAGAAVLRDWRRGALLASLVLAAFFSFGHVWNLVGGFFVDRLQLAGAYIVVGLALVWLIWYGGRWVRPATQLLNIALLFLVAFNAFRIADFALGWFGPTRAAGVAAPIEVQANDEPPDIYYVVLDRYANAGTLRRMYGHDNTPFLDALRDRGFAIADDAWANYFKTALSLTAALSADYLDAARYDLAEPPSFAPIHAALQDHLPVPLTLKSLGYEYIHLGSYWEPSSTNVDADIVLRYQEVSEFDAALLGTTAWSIVSPPVNPDDDPETIEFPELARESTLFAFDTLEETAERPGPTFVFAHLLVPHPPYVFDSDGSRPRPADLSTRSDEESYVRQLTWANGRLLAALDRLLDVPEGEEPVIILAADEGPFPRGYAFGGGDFPWLEATPDEIQQKFGILTAMRLPGVDPAELGFTDRTSPVNIFRIVFNAYFGAELPLLPDVTYLSPDHEHIYDFVEYPR